MDIKTNLFNRPNDILSTTNIPAGVGATNPAATDQSIYDLDLFIQTKKDTPSPTENVTHINNCITMACEETYQDRCETAVIQGCPDGPTK